MTPEDILTKVLKRGKTATVVAHRARELGMIVSASLSG